MASNDQADDVATYAASVRAALSNLPTDQSEVLLEDLEDHLREIAADAGGPLHERLGPPQQYAEELRAAYGAAQVTTRRQAPALHDLQRALARVTGSTWYRQIRAFLPELRPAWWVLRAYLAVLILMAAVSPGYPLGPIPDPTSKRGLVEILATGIAIWLSVRIGRRSRQLSQKALVLAYSANLLIALFAVVVLANMRSFAYSELTGATSPQQTTFANAFAAGQVTNIYPYSQDGKPLTNAFLYYQDALPIVVDKSEATTRKTIGAAGNSGTNAYPLTQRHLTGDPVVAPRVVLPPWPSPSPTASPNPTPSPSPSH